MQKLILHTGQCPGDVVVMTAAVRELHRQYPNQYQTDVRTCAREIWQHNPFITPIADNDPAVRRIEMHYPLINQSNQRPVHFLEGYCEYLAGQLGLPSLRPQEFRGDIYLSDEERGWINQVEETTGYRGPFWLVNAGSKNDFTCKQWPIESFQAVIDHFRDSSRHAPPCRRLEGTSPTTSEHPDRSEQIPSAVCLDSSRHTPCAIRPRIQFVQIGAAEHNHPALDGVIDLRGKTDHRQLIRLVYHSSGILTGVSYPMHLAAAVPVKEGSGFGVQGSGTGSVGNALRGVPLPLAPGEGPVAQPGYPPAGAAVTDGITPEGGRATCPSPCLLVSRSPCLRPLRGLRPCVVINGGREPPHWEQYPGHQFLHTIGALDCCATGGCWKSRVVALGDGDHKDRDLCPHPIAGHPRCMRMITPDDVIRAIEKYESPAFASELVGESTPEMPADKGTRRHGDKESYEFAPTRYAPCLLVSPSPCLSVSSFQPLTPNPQSLMRILIDFRHGLGDAVQLTTVLLHLRHYHPDWQIDLAAGIGKLPTEGSGFRGQGSANANADDGSVRNALCGVPMAADAALRSPLAPQAEPGLPRRIAPIPIEGRTQDQCPSPHGVSGLRAEGSRAEGGPPAAPPELSRVPLPLYHRLLVRDRDPIDRAAYQHVFDLAWDECPTCYADSPSTKAEHCLRTVFNLEPISELCRYELAIGAAAFAAAKAYLQSICGSRTNGELWTTDHGLLTTDRFPVALLHYQANTSTEKKNLSHELARRVCEAVIEAGYVPVILDWDKRSPLPDAVRIFNPGTDHPLWGRTGTGDCEVLAALIAQASLFIGIDSGPLHVAGALEGFRVRGSGFSTRRADAFADRSPKSLVQSPKSHEETFVKRTLDFGLRTLDSTPVLAVWTGHHPLHYFCPADHVTHLVPEDHASRLRGDRAVGEAFFEKHYRYRSYRLLDDALPALVQEILAQASDGLLRTHGYWVRGDNAEQDLVIVRDIAEQDSYRIAELDVPGPIAMDIGAHIGVFSRAFKQRHPSARVVAVECCPENITALQRNVGDFASIVAAACTYERQPMALMNAVWPGCLSTGGSRVVPACALSDEPTEKEGRQEYWADERPLTTVTLEDIMAEHQLDHIDVLKLDCEGSEFSILENTTSLERIGAIIGEYHGRERFLELVARKFGDWRLRILHDGDPGTFWLVNPRSVGNALAGVPRDALPLAPVEGRGEGGSPTEEEGPPGPSSRKRDGLARPSSRTAEFWTRFRSMIHPLDQPVPATWQRYYGTLFELAAELRPRRVCEIGVRAGYSAFAILSANPNAVMFGVEADLDEATHNTHNGRKGLFRHAEQILAAFNYQLLIADSHALGRLPTCDLVYIDGEHTFDGCLADLRLAEKSTDTILVDDYDSIAGVRQACDYFADECPSFKTRYLDNGLTGFLLFQRAASP